MNLFTLHTKNGFYIYRCLPINSNQTDANRNLNFSDEENVELINNFKPDCIWSQDRFARQCVCSYNNNLSVLDDRSGLSIIYMKNESNSELSIDTLRGVGKFKNMYTPLGCKNIKHLQWSNNGTYLAVYFNLPNYAESGLCLEDNLHIWDISKKNIVATFSTRRLSPEQWPVIKWLGSTDNFALCHNHQVNLYSIVSEPSSLKTLKSLLSIQVPMVFSVELFFKPSKGGVFSNGDRVYLSCFSPNDANKTPGNLLISTLEWNNDTLVQVSTENHELKFTDSADMLWSPSGRYLIVVAQSTVDMAGEKYGSTANCLLYTNKGRYLAKVNTATTHDVRWNPKSDEFILMQGNMPCKITLYNTDLEAVFEFPNMYRNTIKWNPMGNMVALGGFGNLAGEICFWYRKHYSDEMEQIVQFKEPCTVIAEWSLDSRYFMTASTFPRMKVDNFYKIFNCEGYLIASESVDECYDVSWFCGNQDETEFIRPKVRKSLVRKAVYRPKVLQKTVKPVVNSTYSTKFPRAPGSPIFSSFKNIAEAQASFSPPKPKSFDNSQPKDKYSKSMFSSEYGNNCDPSTDLLQSFKHIFSLSFMKNGNQMVDRQPNQRMPNPSYRQHDGYNHDHRNNRHKYGDNGRHHYNNGDNNTHSNNSRHSYPDVGRGNYMDGVRNTYLDRPAFSDNQRQAFIDTARQGLSYNSFGRNGGPEEVKQNSMFIKLKNQLHSDRVKTPNTAIMDEGQLLRLLLEAKIRSKPN